MQVSDKIDLKVKNKTSGHINLYKDEKKFRFKSFLIFILNISDLILTWFFVIKHNEYFLELNPVANKIIINFPLTVLIKLSVLFLVLLFLKIRSQTASSKALRRIYLAQNIIICFYLIINLMHIINSIFLLFYV